MIGLKWTGWDGSVWDLRNGPVKITNGGMSGLSHAPYDVFARDTAERDGQILTGWRAKPRDVLLPVRIGQSSLSPQEWLTVERAWWKTMRPGKYGTLRATAPDGSARELTLRFVDDDTASYAKDPSIQGATNIALRMIADDPWWYGDGFGDSFGSGSTGDNFYGGAAGYGPPFYISRTDRVASAAVTNPGDMPVYPDYTIRGPITAFSITVDGLKLAGTITLLAGESINVETNPLRQLVTKTDSKGVVTNVTRSLTSTNFRPISEGESVKLNVSLTGKGSFSIAGRPAYYRGW